MRKTRRRTTHAKRRHSRKHTKRKHLRRHVSRVARRKSRRKFRTFRGGFKELVQQQQKVKEAQAEITLLQTEGAEEATINEARQKLRAERSQAANMLEQEKEAKMLLKALKENKAVFGEGSPEVKSTKEQISELHDQMKVEGWGAGGRWGGWARTAALAALTLPVKRHFANQPTAIAEDLRFPSPLQVEGGITPKYAGPDFYEGITKDMEQDLEKSRFGHARQKEMFEKKMEKGKLPEKPGEEGGDGTGEPGVGGRMAGAVAAGAKGAWDTATGWMGWGGGKGRGKRTRKYKKHQSKKHKCTKRKHRSRKHKCTKGK